MRSHKQKINIFIVFKKEQKNEIGIFENVFFYA